MTEKLSALEPNIAKMVTGAFGSLPRRHGWARLGERVRMVPGTGLGIGFERMSGRVEGRPLHLGVNVELLPKMLAVFCDIIQAL